MNIFYLDPDPKICAQYHVDKHVVKMIIEYAQLMSTAHRILDGEQYTDLTAAGRRIQRWRLHDEREAILYKASHINHPSAIWTRDSEINYRWLFTLWTELLDEYTHRYGKIHACAKLLTTLAKPPRNIKFGEPFYAPTPAMPQDLKIVAKNPVAGRKYDVLASYKNYYIKDKARFARWKTVIHRSGSLMPRYDFMNKETGQVEEHTMSYKDLDQFKVDNPHLERYFSPENVVGLGDGMRMDTPGTGKADSTFEKYIINRMKETIPGNTIKSGHKTKMPREW